MYHLFTPIHHFTTVGEDGVIRHRWGSEKHPTVPYLKVYETKTTNELLRSSLIDQH